MTVETCLLKHLGAKSPINAYRADMAADVAELVADGMTSEAAWIQVVDAKLTDLKAERTRIEQVVADAYAKTAAGKPAEAKPVASTAPKPAASANTIFTEDAAAAARARLKAKLGRLTSGLDPETLMDGITLAGYHVEKGARTFAAYARAMVDDMGNAVKPYLQQWYMALRADPKAGPLRDDMDKASAVEDLDIDAVLSDTETVPPKAQDAARNLDRPGQGALARELADDVQPPEGGRAAGGQSAPGGRGNVDGAADADGTGLQLSGGMGAGTGVLPVPAGGSGRKPRGPAKRRVQGDGGVQPGLGFAENAGGTGGLIPVNPAPNAEPPAPPAFTPEDFVIEDDLGLGEGGQKTKYQGNVEAIRLLRELEDDGRLATPSEQRVLAKYVGWGGLAQAFDENNASWSKEYAELKALLSDDEYADAARSTRYAHYTSREIIQDGLYAALRHMGFRGGRMLEAGAGVGNFIGLMPSDMRTESRFTAIEREPFSAAIARHLYPRQIVREADFTEFVGNDDYYDAAVGNPPFASDPQVDASGRKHLSGLSLHNYFFAKAVDMLRDGGILAQVVTNGFLDAKSDTARRYISDRTTLLGAIRLPNNAFSKNANTEVTTDLIFLQKRPESEWGGKAARLDAKRWLDTGTFEDAEGREVPLNQYFIDNPQMMLGQFGAYGTMYRGESPALISRPGQDTAAMLRDAVQRLPSAVYVDRAVANTAAMADEVIQALRDPTVQEGGYFNRDGKLYQRIKDVAGEARERQVTNLTKWTEKTLLGASGVKRITALADMRATLRALLAAELSSDKGMEALRATLNTQYDAYTKEFGLINDPGTMRVFDDDPDFPLLSSLEHGYTRGMGAAAAKTHGIKPYPSKASKAPIFSRRVIEARKQVKAVESPADALAVSMAERGKLDSAYIGQLLDRNPDEVLKELSEGDRPLLFMDPADNQYVLRDAYLSGNVREKLAQANQAGLFANVRALEEVQPEDVGAHEINARIGSPWVPESVYESFAKALFGPGTKARISYTKLTAAYTATIEPENGTANTSTWGTPSYHGDSILVALLNNRPIRVTYKDADGNMQTDKPATEAANIKAQEVRDKFQDWLFADAERSELLVRAYNDTNNNYVTREFDGSWMTFPGKVPDAIVKFRRHQRNAIARIVQDRTALLDHVVGAGKTYTIVAGAMELKRTGLAKKPLIVVPNHLVKQWAADFYRLYPGANILTATKKDFEKANRRKFLAKIATGDWDAVIMAHSSFGFIKPAPEFESRFNTKQIKNIVDTIKQVEDGDGDKQQKKRTVKQLEGLKERLENRIKSLRDKPMDALLDFDEIGVDQLFVDEAHLFKNLMFSTKMQNIAGLGDSKGSQRAYDMYVKANEVFDKNGRGQGLVFATGTPVSNTMAEMYHMMRYLMPRQMEAMGFESFDAWANTYASVEQVWMQKASGDGFKAQNRMSNFVNTTELLKVFDQVADTVTMDDIKAAFSEENNGAEFPLPKLKGGKRTPVSLRKSAAQNTYMADIAGRALALEQRRGPPQKGEDNILVIMSDARKAAMDIRLVDPTVTEREPGGRIDRSAQEIAARYKQYDSVKGTQLVFSDLGTPLKTVKKELAEYQELLARIEAGQGDQVATAANLGDESAIAKVEDAENAANELEEKGRDWVGAMQAAMRGFSVYDDLKAALIEKGIPASEIAFIHDYSTDDQKAALFRKVNAGQIRVLMGSTPKLGAGTNVQERLVALHHLDVPWKPSDVEQREGRIIRQGNQLDGQIPGFEVEVLAYVTQESLDMRMWQVQETKLKMINQLRTRKVGREVDNAFEDLELSAGEMQAAATGNMDLLREIQLRADIKNLERRKRAFDAQKSDLQNRMRAAEAELASLPAKIEKSRVMAQASTAYKAELAKRTFKATIDGKEYTDAYEAGQYLRGKVDAHVYSKGKGDSKRTITAEQYDALSEEDRRPDVFGTEWKREALPLSVEFNGETYTSRTKLGEAFAEFRGDVTPIAWTYDGTEYKSRKPLAHALRQDVADSLVEQTPKKVGNIGPFAVTVEGQRNKWGDFVEVMLEASSVEISNSVGASGDAEKLAAAIVTAADNMASNAQSQYDYEQHKLKRAIKTKAELDATPSPGEWPDQPKLEKAREAHKKILRSLATAGTPVAAPEPGSTIETLSGDMQASGGYENESDVVFSLADRVDAMRQRGPNAGLANEAAPADTAAYGTVSQADRFSVKKLEAALGAARSGLVLDPRPAVDGAQAGQPLRGLDRTRVAAAELAQRLFDKQVTYFTSSEPFANGLVSSKQPNRVFVLHGASRPHMAILGHELLHSLRIDRPDLYAKLADRIMAVTNDRSDADMGLQLKRLKAGLPTLDDNLLEEEFVADVVGDRFTEPEFWQLMAKDQPAGFKAVIQAVLKFLDDTLSKIADIRPFGTEVYLKDIQAAREAVADALRNYSAGEVGAMAGQGETISLSIAGSVAERVDQIRGMDQTKMRNALADLLGSAGAKVSWWDKYLGTQYAKAEKFPAYKRVFDRVQSYIEDVSTLANEAADQAPEILPKLENLKDLKQSLKSYGLKGRDAVAVAAPVFQGTLNDQKVYGDEELRDRFGLNDKQIGQYRQFLAAVNVSLDQVVAADVLKLLGDKNPGLRDLALADRGAMRSGIDDYLTEQAELSGEDPAATDDDRGPMTKLRDDIREKYERIDKLKSEGYAPLMRFGKYKVFIADPETGDSLFFGLYETRAAANRMARDLAEDPQFKDARIEQGVLSEDQYKLFNSVPVESLEMFAEAVGAEKSEVFQAYLRLAKNNRSALKRLIHRKGTAGFSEDVGRVLAAFVTSNSRLASGAINLTAANGAVQDIRDGDIKDEAIRLVESVQNPKETAAGVRALLFTNFIGGSIASAMVNLTQPVTMTLPYLSQFGGLAKATGRLMAAGKMVAGGKIRDPELAAAMKRAEDDGIVSPQEIHHLQAQAMGTWGTSALAKQAAFIWGAPFSLAEQFNRRVSFVAAYQTAKEQGIGDPFAFAEKAVVETQGLYNKGNMPNLSRNAIGAAAMQFKQFSIHYLEWMKRMWNAGEPGSAERRAGRKAVLIALALLMVAAGADGLPFADDMDDLIDTLGQALGYDTNSKKARRDFVAKTLGLGDMTADVFARGLSAMPGVPLDVSLRMSMGDLIPGSGLMLRSNTDRSRDLLEIAGPAGGLARQYMDASEKALAGDFTGAAAGFLPMAAQNALKAMDMWSTGEARDMRGSKVMDADQVDGLMKFFGFNPQSIARESQKMGMIRRSEQLAKNVEGEIASRWARAFADGDAEGVRDARQEVADWNRNNPGARIQITSAQIIQRVRKLRQSRAQRFITSVSPERRRDVTETMQ